MPMIDTPMTGVLGRFLDLTAYRESLIGSNLANVDTPGYRTRDINFRQELERTEAGELQYASYSPLAKQVRGLIDRPDGNNVSLERETLLLAETQMRFSIGVQLLRAEFHRVSSAIHEGNATS